MFSRAIRAATQAIVVGAACWASPAFAVVIDDFSVGQIVVDNNTPVDQVGLDPAHVIGGSRRIAIGQFGSGSRLQVTDDGQMVLSSTGAGYHTVSYGAASPLGGVDLTAGGHDRLRLTLGEIGRSFHPFSIYVNLPTNSSRNGVGLYIRDEWDRLVLEFPYASFPVAFTSVRAITLDAIRNRDGTAYALDSLVTAGPAAPGDFNRDGATDSGDLGVWQRYFGINTRNGALAQAFATSDANTDGQVDGTDFQAWQRALPADTKGPLVVPEAAMFLLALMALVGLITSRGRRRPQ